jgi:hypothetical protein
MAFDGRKAGEAYFMAGRGTAGKRFLAHRRHPSIQICRRLASAWSQKHAPTPANARMVALPDPAASFAARSEPADFADQETDAAAGRGGVDAHKIAKIGPLTRLASRGSIRDGRMEIAF